MAGLLLLLIGRIYGYPGGWVETASRSPDFAGRTSGGEVYHVRVWARGCGAVAGPPRRLCLTRFDGAAGPWKPRGGPHVRG